VHDLVTRTCTQYFRDTAARRGQALESRGCGSASTLLVSAGVPPADRMRKPESGPSDRAIDWRATPSTRGTAWRAGPNSGSSPRLCLSAPSWAARVPRLPRGQRWPVLRRWGDREPQGRSDPAASRRRVPRAPVILGARWGT